MKKNVVLGVTGGIACYKSADLVSRLKKKGYEIDVIMTASACEFVQPQTFQTLSSNPVVTDLFSTPKYWEVEHIALAKKADVFVVAPATANVIGKVAGGIADDMLTTTIMATKAPVVFAPAMNTAMYENPIVQENILRLKGKGYRFVEPGAGLLACGDTGKGRMAEPEEIAAYLEELLSENDVKEVLPEKAQDFAGCRMLVTAGPTVEDIDPVRFISNRSSGKMGYAIAEAAQSRGAEVVLVSGPVNLQTPEGVRRVNVRSTRDMLEACRQEFEHTDVVIKAAAPADFHAAGYSDRKIKKDGSGTLTLELSENPDILASLGAQKGDRILVGFAAETNDLEMYAQKKIRKKNLDMIVANDVSQPGAGFDHDTNIITLIMPDGQMSRFQQMEKRQAADVILDHVAILRSKKNSRNE